MGGMARRRVSASLWIGIDRRCIEQPLADRIESITHRRHCTESERCFEWLLKISEGKIPALCRDLHLDIEYSLWYVSIMCEFQDCATG